MTHQTRADHAADAADLELLWLEIAHDVNNLLGCVLHHIDAALVPDSLDPEQRRTALGDARDGISRVAEILRDARSVTRGAYVEQAIDVPIALALAIRMVRPRIAAHIPIQASLEPTPAVRGTRSRLLRVFMNLLINAGEALEGDPGADARISVHSRTTPEGWAEVEICDDGPGIPEALASSVFAPFVSGKREDGGLGLSTCRRIVVEMAGLIACRSHGGRGTCFLVTLPPAGA